MLGVIRLAIENQMRPSAVLYREPDPYTGWTDLDYSFVQAYQVIKDEQCPKCGNPVWLCRSTDSNIDWSVDSVTCYASRAIEGKRYREDNPGKQPDASTRKNWGMEYVARPVPIRKDVPLPTRSSQMDA